MTDIDYDYKICCYISNPTKPFTYAAALDLYGAEYVNKYVGQEPSGSNFNEICLDKNSLVWFKYTFLYCSNT